MTAPKMAKEYRDTLGMRRYQRDLLEAMRKNIAKGKRVTVGLAAPGAGKDLAWKICLTDLMRNGSGVRFGLGYVPRVILASQSEIEWTKKWRDKFDPSCRPEKITHRMNRPPLIPLDRDGVIHSGAVFTYQSLVEEEALHLDWAKEHAGQFLLHADEAQFCGSKDDDAEAGGTKAGRIIKEIAKYAHHTILQTGSWYRSDGGELILCEYVVGSDGKKRLVRDVTYFYRDGVAEQTLVRCYATTSDGEYNYHDLKTQEATGYKISDQQRRGSLTDLLNDDAVVCQIADSAVRQHLVLVGIYPGYRSLFACQSQKKARKLEGYLKSKYPRLKVFLSVSEDGPTANRVAMDFKTNKGAGGILITVRKAFIGYDCPAVKVICVLTNYREEGHLLQLVGRGFRFWKESGIPWIDQGCYIFAPHDKDFQLFLANLIEERDKGISEIKGGGGGCFPPQPSLGYIGPVTMTDQYGFSSNGSSFDPGLMETCEAVMANYGHIHSPVEFAEAMKRVLAIKNGQNKIHDDRPEPESEDETDQQKTKRYLSIAGKRLRTWIKQNGGPRSPEERYKALYNEINKRFGIKSTEQISTAERAYKYMLHMESELEGISGSTHGN